MKQRIIRFAIPIVLLAVMIVSGYTGVRNRSPYRYFEHLDEVAVSVDGEDITLRDMLFYVAFEENKIETDAYGYNPDNTIEYWNIHTNGAFFKDIAKDTVMGMTLHDWLFYKEAYDMSLVLTSDERSLRENAKTDFWDDLYDVQYERLGGYEEIIDKTIDRIALSQKYQRIIEEKQDAPAGSYDWDGTLYESYSDGHEVIINKRVWDRVVLGDITLQHDLPSFLPTYKGASSRRKIRSI